jgi:hypothetical protein
VAAVARVAAAAWVAVEAVAPDEMEHRSLRGSIMLRIRNLLACVVALTVTCAALADVVEVRMRNGKAWRGDVPSMVLVKYLDRGVEIEMRGRLTQVAPLYITIEGDVAGKMATKTIFRDDLVLIESSKEPAAAAPAPGKNAPKSTTPAPGAEAPSVGVFVLPLEGPVGEVIRYDEIEAMGEYCDQYGPGQILVLKISSNGGLVSEAELISEAIEAVAKRHRVIAWVDKAISAGCSTAMSCDEIYFMTTGTAGSVTTLMGNRSVPEDFVFPDGTTMREHVERFVELAKRHGYSEHIARAMKFNHHMCTYDKDPKTGKVTWYGDLSGEFKLSDANSNLCFNSSNALHSGFSKGTADTVEELARLLDLKKWHEVSDHGRKIAKQWQETSERAKEEIQRLAARLEYWKIGGGNPEEILGARISILKKLIRWWDRAPNVAQMMLPEKWQLERELAELMKQMADMQKNRR